MDLKRIEKEAKEAEKASPGAWEARRENPAWMSDVYFVTEIGPRTIVSGRNAIPEARHIANMDPPATLEILAKMRASNRDLDAVLRVLLFDDHCKKHSNAEADDGCAICDRLFPTQEDYERSLAVTNDKRDVLISGAPKTQTEIAERQ